MTGQSAAQPKCQWTIGDIVAMGGLAVAEAEPEPHRDETAWFVLCVEPRTERRVADDLRKAKRRAYVPEQSVMRRTSHRRRYAACVMPLFPGYVFADLLPTPEAWHAARAVRGVNGFVTVANGITPVRIDDEVIGDIMSAQERGLLTARRLGDMPRIVTMGTRVIVLGGPHDGVAAVVVRGGMVTAKVRPDYWPASRKPMTIAVDRLALLP